MKIIINNCVCDKIAMTLIQPRDDKTAKYNKIH